MRTIFSIMMLLYSTLVFGSGAKDRIESMEDWQDVHQYYQEIKHNDEKMRQFFLYSSYMPQSVLQGKCPAWFETEVDTALHSRDGYLVAAAARTVGVFEISALRDTLARNYFGYCKRFGAPCDKIEANVLHSLVAMGGETSKQYLRDIFMTYDTTHIWQTGAFSYLFSRLPFYYDSTLERKRDAFLIKIKKLIADSTTHYQYRDYCEKLVRKLEAVQNEVP